ncbi:MULTISPECIES: hypothetical protein [Mesobacillus]|uniref:Uncharacterized protein n=2 Tax=Mesobacillus TaxID=2675231 RepID=A0A0D6Z7Q0_9BACI|nr:MULTISPECIES: hypothetical protein [Mesobacillus]KIY20623.1 hypothetical protein UB32_18295 [Mesobacillus subterraneus]MDQ0413590.1 hypothetical protein [Mesobacillus stamsii]
MHIDNFPPVAFPSGVSSTGLWTVLLYYYQNGAIIPEVYVRNTQQTTTLDLVAVRIVTLGTDFVIFEQVTSPGVGLILVMIEDIIAIDLPS